MILYNIPFTLLCNYACAHIAEPLPFSACESVKMEVGRFFFLTFAVSAVCVAGAAVAGRHGTVPVYTNSWAVEVEGGGSDADALAAKYGFINKGSVSLACNFPPRGCCPKLPNPANT